MHGYQYCICSASRLDPFDPSEPEGWNALGAQPHDVGFLFIVCVSVSHEHVAHTRCVVNDGARASYSVALSQVTRLAHTGLVVSVGPAVWYLPDGHGVMYSQP